MPMSPQEAATMLSLSIAASIDEVRARYQDLYSDYQIRLTNAPTPKLKRTYQEKLQQLREACQALAPDIVIDAEKDLPSPEPIHDIASPAERRHSEPTRSTQATVTDHNKKSAGLPRATMVASLLAVVFAAAAVYCFMQWLKSEKEVTRISASRDEQRAALERISGEAEALESTLRMLDSGKLIVRNRATNTITIIWIAATYIDDDGAYQTVNSAFYDFPKWEIEPEGKVQLNMQNPRKPNWNGETIFYAMRIIVGDKNVHPCDDNEVHPYAGLWSELERGVLHFHPRKTATNKEERP